MRILKIICCYIALFGGLFAAASLPDILPPLVAWIPLCVAIIMTFNCEAFAKHLDIYDEQ